MMRENDSEKKQKEGRKKREKRGRETGKEISATVIPVATTDQNVAVRLGFGATSLLENDRASPPKSPCQTSLDWNARITR